MKPGMILSQPLIADQIEAAQLAEANGFDSVWATEFFHQNGLVRMSALAAATERVKIGSAIVNSFTRTPVLTASGIMDIDEISGGRAILGLGTGTRSMNSKWYSVPFDAPPAPRMEEVVKVVRAAFAAKDGGGLKFEGEHYNVSIPHYFRPNAPREQIPIYVAAVNQGMIRCAARVADGLVGHPVYTREYIKRVVLPTLEGSQCQLAPYVICSISEDVELARNEVRAQIAFYYTTAMYHSILDANGWREQGETIAAAFKSGNMKAMVEAVNDDMIDEIAITGPPDEVRQRLEQWRGLTEQPLIYSPSIGMSEERTRENYQLIAETFNGWS
jgi:probable F420-dependent oxidoreductase